jgi:RNA polymerase sigma-70 factor (ECF subfamily)
MSVLKSKRERRKTGTGLSDDDLWAAFAAGDDSAYTLLYFRFSDRLYAYLKMVLGTSSDRHLIDDIFQETWIKVYHERDHFVSRGPGTFAGWLFRIAHNFAVSLLRRPHFFSSLDEVPESFQVSDVSAEGTFDPLSDLRTAEELLGVMREIVDTLPLMFKEIYVLSEFERFSLDELSQTLGISRANAKVRLFRARKIVRAKLLATLEIKDRRKDDDDEDE